MKRVTVTLMDTEWEKIAEIISIETLRTKSHISLKQVLVDLLRAGIEAWEAKKVPKKL